MGKRNELFGKTIGLEFGKRTARSTVGMQRIKDWTLWKVSPLRNRKKETARIAGAGNVEASAPNVRKRQRKQYQDAARDEHT
jgi:hypothetical protein